MAWHYSSITGQETYTQQQTGTGLTNVRDLTSSQVPGGQQRGGGECVDPVLIPEQVKHVQVQRRFEVGYVQGVVLLAVDAKVLDLVHRDGLVLRRRLIWRLVALCSVAGKECDLIPILLPYLKDFTTISMHLQFNSTAYLWVGPEGADLNLASRDGTVGVHNNCKEGVLVCLLHHLRGHIDAR